MDQFYQNSIHLIIQHQSQEGAFIACPNFKTYQYAWFRDGSFCAYALNQAGYSQNAFQFHQWASGIVLRYESKLKNCIHAAQSGNPPPAELCFHSRFTLDGFEVPGGWGHHQLDGLGLWLWSMIEYLKSNPETKILSQWRIAAILIKDYLTAMWAFPCSDCWEEHETGRHTYTLASIFAGLQSFGKYFNDPRAVQTSLDIRAYILSHCVNENGFVKSVGATEVDSNLLGLVYPFHLVEWNHPIFQKTIARIQSELQTPIGLHRYLSDTYYGGGEWVLLTGWLGWSFAQADDMDKAKLILEWTIKQFNPQGELPEQVPHGLVNKDSLALWLNKWGPIASPLLWSHAMYLLLIQSIEQAEKKGS